MIKEQDMDKGVVFISAPHHCLIQDPDHPDNIWWIRTPGKSWTRKDE